MGHMESWMAVKDATPPIEGAHHVTKTSVAAAVLQRRKLAMVHTL